MKGKVFLLIPATVLAGSVMIGCSSSDTLVTKEQEEAFRNPPKEIPPESLKAMQKAREEGMRKAAEMRQKSSGQ